ncbi:hypothetical protein Kpho02_76450 [Kitasatospora phosalacinea]|uniref:Uncharacterized protein n=1 Tax=Kitasatospora phosalacinea TaxID=2065 RepID=A0A9W6V6J0_9ACTN|nr:hypothetical protein Kpho02_76450 [Kitasatospora phosalacinea]
MHIKRAARARTAGKHTVLSSSTIEFHSLGHSEAFQQFGNASDLLVGPEGGSEFTDEGDAAFGADACGEVERFGGDGEGLLRCRWTAEMPWPGR